jgi:hypothetical protein
MADVTSGSGSYAVDTPSVIPDGWLLFSGMMILFTGIWNLFEGIFAFFRSTWFIGHTIGGSLWIWAIVLIAFGVLQMLAGAAVMSHRGWGRWFGIVTVGLVTFVYLLNIGIYPFWSFVIIGINIIVLYGLTVHWNKSAEDAY